MPTAAWVSVVVLGVLIVAAAVLLFITPAPAPAAFTSENVNVFSPLPDAVVPRAFTVSGEARGTWFFEASFPIKVQDPNNDQVGLGIAQAQADWMTENFVPFTATVTVGGYSGPAILVLLKDNPSGLPENDNSVEFPIVIQ